MELARAWEKDRPQDAPEIYRSRIDGIIDVRQNPAYDDAAELVERIKALMDRAGEGWAFAEWLEALRKEHKAKRNFMKRIEGLR